MTLLADKIKDAMESLNNDERNWRDFTPGQIASRVADMLTSEGIVIIEDGIPQGTGATLKPVPKTSGDDEEDETEEKEEESEEEEELEEEKEEETDAKPKKKKGRR